MEREDYLKIENILRTNFCYEISHDESLVFVGMTGRGKSSLINYLIGNQMKGIESSKKGRLCIDTEIYDSRFPVIGHRFCSETLNPQGYKFGAITYYDMPGLLDTRGNIKQFEVALYYQKLLSSLKKFKIILVFDAIADLLSAKATNLLSTIKEFSGFIDSFAQIKSSFMVVVTKVKDLDLEEIKEIFQSILQDHKISGQNAEILKYLAGPDSPIGIFHSPTGATKLGFEDKTQIEQLIDKRLSYHLGDFISNVSLSGEAKDLMSSFIAKTINIIDHQLFNKFFKSVQTYFKDKIDTYNDIHKLEFEFISISAKLEKIKKFGNKVEDIFLNLAQIETCLGDIEVFTGTSNIVSEFHRYTSNLSLLYDLKVVTSDRLAYKIPISFSTVPKAIRSILDISYNDDAGDIKIQGHIIPASFIISHIKKEDKVIKVFATNLLVIDQDIEAQGVSMVMISPICKVIGTRIIDLSGGNGVVHKNSKADKGEDGLPGNPGGNGGDFYGKWKKLDLKKGSLVIKSNGGDGGNGQDGGEGIDGRNGDVSLVSHKTAEAFMNSENVTDWSCAAYDAFYEGYCSFGDRGGSGGRGGISGRGGQEGKILLDYSDLSIVKIENLRGLDGENGLGGLSGADGISYYGTFLRTKLTFGPGALFVPYYLGNILDAYLNEGWHVAPKSIEFRDERYINEELNFSGRKVPIKIKSVDIEVAKSEYYKFFIDENKRIKDIFICNGLEDLYMLGCDWEVWGNL